MQRKSVMVLAAAAVVAVALIAVSLVLGAHVVN